MKETIFKNSDSEFIKIINPCKESHWYRFDEIKIVFAQTKNELVLYDNDYLGHALEVFNTLLDNAIKNQASFNEKQDVGYMWNELLHYRPTADWQNSNILLWESISRYDTWLYNQNNSIILEITPVYKWHFDDPKEHEEFIPYEEFIKTYRPIAKIEIDKETAKKWLHQTEVILKTIEENDKIFLNNAK